MDHILRKEREGPLSIKPSQQTFCFLKPETVKGRLVGEVLGRLERKGFTFKALKLHHMTKHEAEQLYAIHKGKSFFQELVSHVTSGPVVLMLLEAPDAVETLRRVIGNTDPRSAEPGTIRGDLSLSITANIIHASDSSTNAEKESTLFF